MKRPSNQDQAFCLELRKRSKRGEYLNKENREFIEWVWRNFEEWYCSTEKEIFEQTKPYGA